MYSFWQSILSIKNEDLNFISVDKIKSNFANFSVCTLAVIQVVSTGILTHYINKSTSV